MLTTPEYELIKQNFLEELTLAAHGETASLPFIKHKTRQEPVIHAGIVQGIVIGGTNYIVSTEEILPGGKNNVLHRKTGVLPIFDTEETFFSFLTEHLDSRALAIGVNFGFPLSPTTGPHGEFDGTLIKGTKEHTFAGMVGKSLGSIIREISGKNIPVSVANDTICLTFAGDGTEQGSLIAGTGFNIGLKQQEKGHSFVINLEAGNFNKFKPTEVLKTIDAASDMPGTQLFEKVISGKYLAEYFTIHAQQRGLSVPPITTSQELSALSQKENTDDATLLARALLERSACFVAASLAAVYEFYGRDKLTLIAEGSLLWHGWHYLENIQKELSLLGVPHYAMTMKHVKDSSITGAIGLLTQAH